jgi:replicative DNA helicase
LRSGEFVIVGARPRVGKTSFALNLLEHVAGFSQPVLFVSLEMTRIELGDRLLSSRSGVPFELIRRGSKNSDNRRSIIDAQAELAPLPIFFDDSPRRTIADIAAQARRVKRRSGLALVVIDYLQLIEPDNVRDQRQEQVAKMARRLKTLARELSVPIVCLAQLNREADKAADHKPRLSHLRESGAIEQDADVVILLHRESLYRDDPDLRGKAEAIVAKNRNGRAGTVPLIWNDATTTFVSTPDDFDAGPTEHQDEFEFT